MNPEIISYRGWDNTLRLANDDFELLVTTDVGPRILVYKTPLGENALKIFEDQVGSSGETEWRSRGGHRFCVAPEDDLLSYHIDNGPANWRHDEFSGKPLSRVFRKNLSDFARRSAFFRPPKARVSHCAILFSMKAISPSRWRLGL